MKAWRRLIVLGFIITITQISCNKLTPAGFWKSYKKQLIVIKESDQGLWGGYRKIVWENDITDTFEKKDAIDYSYKNGWHVTDSLIIKNDSIVSLTDYNDKGYSCKILRREIMSLLEAKHIYQVYVFKTGWVAVEPGNATETEKNGFILINENGTKLIMYHLWGE